MRSRRAKLVVQDNSCSRFKVVLLIALFLLVLRSPAFAKYGGGSGEPNDPYLIYTAEQLNTIGLNQKDAGKHFKLMADIDLSDYQGDSFNRIGFYDPPAAFPYGHSPFTGVFDGNDHTISNFTYVVDVNEPPSSGFYGDEDVGLFGIVNSVGNGPLAQIKNLGLIDPNIYPAATCSERVVGVGAIAGSLIRGSITNCYVEEGRVSADGGVGGLVGGVSRGGTVSHCYTTCDVVWANSRSVRPIEGLVANMGHSFGGVAGSNFGQINNCHATGRIQAASNVGGLVGSNHPPSVFEAVISDSYATGDVFGETSVGGLVGDNTDAIDRCCAFGGVSGLDRVGGLVGINWRMGKDQYIGVVTNSYAMGHISGNNFVGGMAGVNMGVMMECYSAGEVMGSSSIGGLVGTNRYLSKDGTADNCFWDKETSGQQTSAGGAGKTTEQMQDPNTFLNVGWDFGDETLNGSDHIWQMQKEPNRYPQLAWESEPRPFITFDLSEDPNWIATGLWEFGKPAGQGGTEHGNPDPNSGFTGNNVYGVNLIGDYRLAEADRGPFYLTTDAIDCSDYYHIQLKFARWLNTDQADYVRTFVDISNDNVNWHTVWECPDVEVAITDDSWQIVTYDISVYAAGQSTVYIRWAYEIFDQDAWVYSGWNIDDIVLVGQQ